MSKKSREKFVALTESRVTRTIKDIRLIGNLSNRSNYSYTDDDLKQIIRVLSSELTTLKQRFDRGGEKENVEFTLDN